LQERDKYLHYSASNSVKEKSVISQAYYEARNGTRFLVPAEYDIVVAYAPVGFKNGSEVSVEEASFTIISDYEKKLNVSHFVDPANNQARWPDLVTVLRPGETLSKTTSTSSKDNKSSTRRRTDSEKRSWLSRRRMAFTFPKTKN
jgi:hypothetical protein